MPHSERGQDPHGVSNEVQYIGYATTEKVIDLFQEARQDGQGGVHGGQEEAEKSVQ